MCQQCEPHLYGMGGHLLPEGGHLLLQGQAEAHPGGDGLCPYGSRPGPLVHGRRLRADLWQAGTGLPPLHGGLPAPGCGKPVLRAEREVRLVDEGLQEAQLVQPASALLLYDGMHGPPGQDLALHRAPSVVPPASLRLAPPHLLAAGAEEAAGAGAAKAGKFCNQGDEGRC